MRKNKVVKQQTEFSILTLDDDEIMTVTLQSYFQSSGYTVDIENDPYRAIERIRNHHYDILLLDFLMKPICGDVVVQKIREFNPDLYIILLTGHKSMAPPIQTIRELDIQGYYEKSDRFDQLELLVESCVKSIRQMRLIRRYQESLQKIVDNIPALYLIQDTQSVAKTVLRQSAEFLEASDLYIYLEQKGSPRPVFEGTGRYCNRPEIGQEGLRRILEQGELSPVCDKNALCFPLIDGQHRVFGIICADVSVKATPDIVTLFELYCKQAGAALSNVFLHTLLNDKNIELENAYASLRDNYLEIITVMRSMVDARDIYTRGHSDRVAFYAGLLAREMGKDEDFIQRIHVAGTFHDIGKIGTSDDILFKSSKLTDQEFDEIKKHSARGKKILSAVTLFQDIAPIVESHHERYDGTGYPSGLRGLDIPEEARMISIADAFDAMTSNRRYRSSMTLEQAKQELIRGKGTQFDAQLVDHFLKAIVDFDSIQTIIERTYSGDPTD